MSKVVLFLFFAIALLSGKNIYVSPDGSDENSGLSLSLPLKSIEKALHFVKPGDEVHLLPGTYFGTTIIENVHGLPDIQIIITSESSERENYAVIDGGAISAPDIFQNAFRLNNVSWLVFQNLKFRNCWTDVILMNHTCYISLANCDIVGGRRVINVKGEDCHHFLIENCTWQQDERVWSHQDGFSWEEMHHLKLRQYNGSIFHGSSIGGGVIIRDNNIKNVYNAIRISPTKGEHKETDKRITANYEIYRNTIINTADNAFEPEEICSNVHFYHNTLINGHAFISITGVSGGPIYFYGNIGWSESGVRDGWTIFKISMSDSDKLEEPFFIFHNSWFVHYPALGGGEAHLKMENIRHFNNAYFFRDTLDFGVREWGNKYAFDNDCSNIGFSEEILKNGGEQNGISADPLFLDKSHGDFRLKKNSSCIDKGKILMGFTQFFEGDAPDIGAYESDKLVEGPAFRFKEPPGGSYYTEKPRIVQHKANGKNLILYFSFPLIEESVDKNSICIINNNQKVNVENTVLLDDGYKLVIETSAVLSYENIAIDMTKLPMGKNKQLATFWGSTIKRQTKNKSF